MPFLGRDPSPSLAHQKTGENTPATNRKKRTGSPMLAKRFIVAAFAALALGMSSLAFSGSNDLFVDLQPAPTDIASIID
jgi:hypothetical protein